MTKLSRPKESDLRTHITNDFSAAEVNFEPILRRRLNLFGLDCDDSLRHLHFRNDRELNFFNNMLYQLQQLHDVLQKISEDEEKVFVSCLLFQLEQI